MKEILDFTDNSPSPFHCVKNIKNMLESKGFEYLENDNIKTGGKYILTKNDSSLIAFTVGEPRKGFRITASHTDSPCPYLKPTPIINKMNHQFFDIEFYGGAIEQSWVDRPLALCGRITVKSDNIFKPEIILVNSKEPIAIIPNLAIHLNRKINDGEKKSIQKELLPLAGNFSSKGINGILSEITGVDEKNILDFELMLYPFEKACLVGIEKQFISSARLDNILMCYASAKALSLSECTDTVNMIYCADNEEIGSLTAQGARSDFLKNTILKISGKYAEEALKNTFVI